MSLETYMDSLYELGRLEENKLTELEKQDLICLMIKENPENIPGYDYIDPNKETLLMLTKWIENESERTAYDILQTLADKLIKSYGLRLRLAVEKAFEEREYQASVDRDDLQRDIDADNRQRM